MLRSRRTNMEMRTFTRRLSRLFLVVIFMLMITYVPTYAATPSVDWTSGTSGTLDGVTVTMSNLLDGGSISSGDLSGADYAAAPLSAQSEVLEYSTGSDWTATFSQPVSRLALYASFWRGIFAEVSPVTYTFSQPFTIVSGLSQATVSGNTLTLPSSGFHDGIILFTGPLSRLSVTTNSQTYSSQALTFALLPHPDTTAPVITPTVNGTQGQNGWYTSDVKVAWSIVDDESPITSQTGCGDQNITADTASVTFTCEATSDGGTTRQHVTIKRDATMPSTSASVNPSDSTATVTLHATDGTSGIASTTYRVDGGVVQSYDAPFTVSGVGTHMVRFFSTDLAGNTEPEQTITFTINQPTPRCLGQTATIYVKNGKIVGGPDNGKTYAGKLKGTKGADVMVGTEGKDMLEGSDGNDLLCGLGGDDTLNGNNDNDKIDGGSGNDKVDGGNGDDQLIGGDGDDTLQGNNGNDTLNAGAGKDRLEGGNGNDTLTGGAGADTFSGGPGTDTATDYTPSESDTRESIP